jgi:YggT family protein
MFIIGNLIGALAQVLDILLWLYMWIVLGRVIVSWVNADPANPIVRFLHIATEPVLERVRQWLPLQAGGFDLSPLLVWLAILFLQRFLVRSLYDLGYALR